ncbi:Acetyltransferase [Escovopsis weberi]|uniref:Acetyltransferase n=1 Tax=Escovopsis weberi TaxID=150374 RepID=A0A0M8MZB3_ESCWE|nr:Acetyltransferase [Escovopsis weberi]
MDLETTTPGQAGGGSSSSSSSSSSSHGSGLLIERIASPAALEPHLASLRRLLQRCVNDDPTSSSIGFLAPLSDQAAIRYWLDLLPLPSSSPSSSSSTPSSSPSLSLLVATHADVPGVLATVQIALPAAQTHAHRGEVRKLLVHPTYRRHGFGRLMMAEVERLARHELGLDVLTLDTAREAPAREFYRRAGWTEFGVAPDYAQWADGRRHACSFFIKSIGAERPERRRDEDDEEERADDP